MPADNAPIPRRVLLACAVVSSAVFAAVSWLPQSTEGAVAGALVLATVVLPFPALMPSGKLSPRSATAYLVRCFPAQLAAMVVGALGLEQAEAFPTTALVLAVAAPLLALFQIRRPTGDAMRYAAYAFGVGCLFGFASDRAARAPWLVLSFGLYAAVLYLVLDRLNLDARTDLAAGSTANE